MYITEIPVQELIMIIKAKDKTRHSSLFLNSCDLMQNKFIFHAIKDKENLKRFGCACLLLLLRVIDFQLYLRIIANPRYKSYHEIM